MKIVSKANYERIQSETRHLYDNLKELINSVSGVLSESRTFGYRRGIAGEESASGNATFVSYDQKIVVRYNSWPEQFDGFEINDRCVSLKYLLDLLKDMDKKKQKEESIKDVTMA